MRLLPTRINVQVARVCNLTCAMCGSSVWQRNRGFMSPQVFERVLEEMASLGLTDMRFGTAQGEPLLAPHWADYVDMATALGISVEINTNCTPLSKKNIARLAQCSKSGRLRVQASFSGYDKASYEFIYAGAKFEDSSAKLKALYDAFEAVDQLGSLCIRGCILDGTSPQRHADYLTSLGIDLSRLAYAAFVNADNFAGIVPYGRGQDKRIQHGRMCPILEHTVVVYDDGKVSACGCRDSEGVMEIGDILTEGFAEMRASPRYRAYVAAFESGNADSLPLCSKCDLPYTA